MALSSAMISKRLLNFKNAFQALQKYPKYSFAAWPGKEDRKLIFNSRVPDMLSDDLKFPYSNSEFNGGVKQVNKCI